jgi:hypothetical protein
VWILPLTLFFVLALSGVELSPLLFLLFIVICCAAMFYFVGAAPTNQSDTESEPLEAPSEEENGHFATLAHSATDVFRIGGQKKAGSSLIREVAC